MVWTVQEVIALIVGCIIVGVLGYILAKPFR